MNPRDADIFGKPRRHRLLRREAAYRPPLPEGVLEDDGADRGIVFGAFTIPQRPIRRRLTGLPAFVVTRGGEYFFVPGLNALRWLAQVEG